MKKRVLILADGAPVPIKHWKRLKNCIVLALDGAANALAKAKYCPHLVMGDFDSISPKARNFFQKQGVPLIHAPDQNFTDLEKALLWCARQKYSDVLIFQALGNRLDHSLHNLFQLKSFYPLKIKLFSDHETISYVQNRSIRIQGKVGKRMAVFPLPTATVSSVGLEWEMKKVRLKIGMSASVSNRIKKKTVSLNVSGSALVIEEGWNFS